jgi:hypothetical protein
MSATPDGTAANSWMHRSQPEQPAGRRTAGDGESGVEHSLRGPTQGWDPYEVWLSRIERPRRRREAMQTA